MKRLMATLLKDLRLQARYGFYFATIFVAVIYIAILKQLPAESLGWLLPVLLLSNLMITAYFFVAGLLLFEKSEGTLEALVVTPVRISEFLISKIVTLTLLGTVECLLIVAVSTRFQFNFLPLAAAVVLLAIPYVLLGFIIVARYESINEFIIPGVVYMLPLSLPLIDYLGIWQSPVFYLHPVQAPLQLVHSAVDRAITAPPLWALSLTALWCGGFFLWARAVFARFIVQQEAHR